MTDDKKTEKKKAPTLYVIIIVKLLKGLLFLGLALVAFRIADRDLPATYKQVLQELRVNPERRFWSELAVKVGGLTAARVRWAAAGTLVYSLFSLVEGTGLIFRIPWIGWMTIIESAFFVPLEISELQRHFRKSVAVVLVLNVFIVWYLYQNRARLFKH
jgi:uncharacterized membrane protein (DUF2068 family)